MALFDIVAGVILIFAFIKGLISGFIKELASVVAIIVGLLGAVMLYPSVSHWISSMFDCRYRDVIAFIGLFIAIALAIHLLARLLHNVVEGLSLSIVNRIAGALFSLFKYAFLISIIVNLFSFFDKESILIEPDKQDSSMVYPMVKSLAPMVLDGLNFESPINMKLDEEKRYLVDSSLMVNVLV